MARRKQTEPTPVIVIEPLAPDSNEPVTETSDLGGWDAQNELAQPVVSDEDLDAAAAVMDPVIAEAARNARKPDISWLEDGTVVTDEGRLPLFAIGDKIVIERYCSMLEGSPWLDTKTYEVTGIDDETGNLQLWNPDLKQHAMSNFKFGLDKGQVIKLAPEKGNIGGRKRGRPRKNPVGKPAPTLAPGEKKRGRGRPPGSKNRPKAEILKDRELKKLERGAKKQATKGSSIKRTKK